MASRQPGRAEGTVRENPPGSKRWQARLPVRLDPRRRPIEGTFRTRTEARRALNLAILEIERGMRAKPSAEARGPVRRLRNVIEDYIEDRRNDPTDPLAIKTIRDYKELLKNVIGHPHANLAHCRATQLDTATIDAWMRDLTEAGFSHPRVKKAFSLVRASLSWEVRKGRLSVNPAREIRRSSTKAGRARRAKADPVLLPSWREVAMLTSHPARYEDRLHLLTMAWSGLRWSESISLSILDIWPDRARLSVTRVYTWNEETTDWEIEEVKAGIAAHVPLPTPLWEELKKLAGTRTLENRKGGELLFRPRDQVVRGRRSIAIDHSNFTRRVWAPARTAAGLTGDPKLPELDPRHRAIHIKDLRAYAASVIVDAGGTPYEAAALLRHSEINTTNRYYARAMDERSQDPARAKLRMDLGLTLEERIDALWIAWTEAYPDLTSGLFDPNRDE